jgi:Tfp pilus assembly protein PilN
MRPVNLLPERLRPHRPTGQLQGSAYAVVGVLGALALTVLLYVVTLNQVNSRTSDTARAESEAQQAEARAATLGPFGQFAQVKITREQSVKLLAEGRIDWERAVRELALVLPPDTWITDLDGSSGAAPAGGSSETSGQAPSGPSTAAASSGKPTLQLVGCAIDQRDVAVLLVRVRRLHGVEDVDLAESGREETETGGGGDTSGAGGADRFEEKCGHDFKFDMTATFVPDGPTAPKVTGTKKVPASLGGGS